jgi:hypothetical protein
MTTRQPYTLACPHCYGTLFATMPGGYCRCACGHTAHREDFERAGARVEPEAYDKYTDEDYGLSPRIIDQYRITKDTPYKLFGDWTIKAGSICKYFAHSDTYLFDTARQNGFVLYYSRQEVEANPMLFEPMEPEAAQSDDLDTEDKMM